MASLENINNEHYDISENLLTFNSKELHLPDFDQTPLHFLIQNNIHDFSKPPELTSNFSFPITYDDSFAEYIFLGEDEDHDDIYELSGLLSNSSDYLNNIHPSKDITENADYIEFKQRIEKRRKDDPYGFLKPEYDSRFWPGRKNNKQFPENSKSQNKQSPSLNYNLNKKEQSTNKIPGSPTSSSLNQNRVATSIENSIKKEPNDILKALLQSKEQTARNNLSKIPLLLNKKSQHSTVQVSLLYATILVDKRKMYRPIFEESPDQFPALHFASFHGDTHCPFERPPQNIENFLISQQKICESKRNQLLNPKLPSAGAMGMNFCELCRVKFKDAKLHHESELHRARARSNIWEKVDQFAIKCNQSFVKNFPIPKDDES